MAAYPPGGHLIDEDMKRALRGLPPVARESGGLTRLTPPPSALPPPVMPSSAAPAPAVVAPPAGAAPIPTRRPVVDPEVAEFARRMAPPESPAVQRAAREEVAAKPMAQPKPEIDDTRPYRMLDALFSNLGGGRYDAAHWQGIEDKKEKKAKEQQAAAKEAEAKQIALEEADPNSERSKKARAPHAPMLRSLGMTDEEIKAFSAADIRELAKGGNIGMKLAEVRRKTAEDKATQERKAAELAEKRKYDEEEWLKRNTLTSEQQDNRTRMLSGLSSGRMVDSALLHDRLARERAAEGEARLRGRQASRARIDEQKKVAEELRKQEQSETSEIVALNALRTKLQSRSLDEKLPGQQSAIEEGAVKVKSKVLGGTGRSAEDSSLDTDLTALGLQAYMNKAHNAPNSEREQNVAAGMFRGDGTVNGALQRIDERLREIEETRKARAKAAKASSSTGYTSVDDLMGDPELDAEIDGVLGDE